MTNSEYSVWYRHFAFSITRLRIGGLLWCLVCNWIGLAGQDDWMVEKLPATVNTEYNEIVPVPSRDGKTLYFTRVGYPDFDRTLIFDTINYAVKLNEEKYLQMLSRLYHDLGESSTPSTVSRATFNQDVWMMAMDSARVTHPPYPLNNALPNSLVAITPDPNAFYIINQFKPEGDMKRGFSVIQRGKDGKWAFPKPVEIKDYYTITSEVNLTMSFDGKVLILSAARFDSKSLDLYICFREGEHRWSAPQHLGNIINSSGREMTPYLSENNRTLFFASDRTRPGTGNLDLYMTRREGDDWFHWSEPQAMTPPINTTTSDESQPYFNMTSGYLYFTSKRDGSSDIFRVQIAPPQATELTIEGRIADIHSRWTLDQCEVIYEIEGQERNIISAPDGSFTLKIPKGIPVFLKAVKKGYSGITDTVFFRQDYYYFRESYPVEIYLQPLKEGDKIELQPIFFQQSKAIILEQSFPELTNLAALLNEHPDIRIRVEGHTDNIGKADDLFRLSQERADAVRDFLIQHKIAPKRIEAIGHGPKFPINDNSSDELRQLNRRVEVIITHL